MRWAIELPELQLCHRRDLITTSDCVFIFGLRIDALTLWDVDLATMSILTKVKFVSGKKLQMLPAVGAYLAQLFDGSDIMVFEDTDFLWTFM